MLHSLTRAGSLVFSLEAGDAPIIEAIRSRKHLTEHGKLADLLDRFGLMRNAIYAPVTAGRDVTALTDSPVLTDMVVHDDDGTAVELGNVWWYRAAPYTDFLETLLRDGHVKFLAADGNERPSPHSLKAQACPV